MFHSNIVAQHLYSHCVAIVVLYSFPFPAKCPVKNILPCPVSLKPSTIQKGQFCKVTPVSDELLDRIENGSEEVNFTILTIGFG